MQTNDIISKLNLTKFQGARIAGYTAFADGYGSTQFGQMSGDVLLESDDYEACRKAAAHHSAGSKAAKTAAVYATVVITDQRAGHSESVKIVRT